MQAFELPLPDRTAPQAVGANADGKLRESLLAENVTWFCRFRWLVALLFLAFGLVLQLDSLARPLGLRPDRTWPVAMAGALAILNLLFLGHLRLSRNSLGRSAHILGNLWTQIILDLLALTVVVYYFGAQATFIAFAYLFHIVLACIFFARGQSFLIVVLASVLYVSCVIAESYGWLPTESIYLDSPADPAPAGMSTPRVINLLLAVSFWAVVWYLGSHLALMVRKRDNELADTNRRLLAAQQLSRQHMLRTTHELKGPFAAIYTQAKTMLEGYFGELPPEARRVAERIVDRSERSIGLVKEMLELARLGTDDASVAPASSYEEVNLGELLDEIIAELAPVALERQVRLETSIEPTTTWGEQEQIRLALRNLVLNAIRYSRQGGRVQVAIHRLDGGQSEVLIADEGIGIPEAALPHIFEEYYRTREAVRHNPTSSGLGLSIVREVALRQHFTVRVESGEGEGTRFLLTFNGVEHTEG